MPLPEWWWYRADLWRQTLVCFLSPLLIAVGPGQATLWRFSICHQGNVTYIGETRCSINPCCHLAHAKETPGDCTPSLLAASDHMATSHGLSLITLCMQSLVPNTLLLSLSPTSSPVFSSPPGKSHILICLLSEVSAMKTGWLHVLFTNTWHVVGTLDTC